MKEKKTTTSMSKHKIGDRVGAIECADNDSVTMFGYGTYAGEAVPAEAAGWIAEGLREMGIPNPKIQLDSGKVVYGCECWWGSEESVRASIGGRRVIEVDIDEVRRGVKC